MKHITHPYIIAPQHRVTVDLIGLGGTGSQMLTNLARIDRSLVSLGHPGLHVRAWDYDTIEQPNIGRQLFSPADLGLPKAVVLVERINRFYGTSWESVVEKYGVNHTWSNILVTCVDTVKVRLKLAERLGKLKIPTDPYEVPYYWLDMGNLQSTGQVVLGTIVTSSPVKGTRKKLKNVVQLMPAIKKVDDAEQGPSCSLAEALEKQDLFINPAMALYGANLLWKLFKNGEIEHQGCYVNLENLIVNPIKIK